MKKFLAIFLAVLVAAACFTGCGKEKTSEEDAELIQAILTDVDAEEEQEEPEEFETPSTVYLNSTRAGAITKAANPVVGINFDLIDNNYTITKTRSNFMIDPIYGGGDPFYVMFDSPDEIVIGDFEYGFATAISTKWEDLIHIYDLENEMVYKVVTPLDTNRIKKVGDNKFAIQCGSAAEGYRSYSFSTSEKYAYDLYENEEDVVMIVDGGHEYDIAIELAQESEGATTEAEETSEEITSEENDEMTATDPSDPEEVKPEESAEETPASQEMEEKAEEAESAAEEEKETSEQAEITETESLTDPESEETASEETEAVSEEEELTERSSEDLSEEEDTEEVSVPEEAGSVEEADEEEEIETTVVRTANDAVTVDLAEEPESALETETPAETEEAALHTEIPGGRIINAPVIPQFPYYPSGCESVSTVMALQYHGVDLSVDDFINRYLDMSNDFYILDGLKYGPSPEQYFIGTPYDNSGFGCLASVIYNALLKIYDYDLTKVENASGLTLEDLCLDYINHDLPVMVWVNIGMIDSFESNTWHLEDGSEFVWKGQEHCMLLVGYDQYNYYFNDPYTGQVLSYGKDISERCYEQQDMQAVVILD